MTSYDGYGRADLLARIAELEAACAVMRRKGEQKLEPLHSSSSIMVGRCLRCGARCELNGEEQCIMGCTVETWSNVWECEVCGKRRETTVPEGEWCANGHEPKLLGRRLRASDVPKRWDEVHVRGRVMSESETMLQVDFGYPQLVWVPKDRAAVARMDHRTITSCAVPPGQTHPTCDDCFGAGVAEALKLAEAERSRILKIADPTGSLTPSAHDFHDALMVAQSLVFRLRDLLPDHSRSETLEPEPCVPGGVSGRRCTTHGMLPLYPNERCLEGMR